MTTEREIPCRAVRVHRICTCGGEMMSTGEGRGSNFGTKWMHRCNGCGSTEELDSTYPKMRFVEEPET